MSWSSRKKKRGHVLHHLFCPRESYLTFVFYLSELNILSEYTCFYTSKNITSETFLLIFKVVKNLQCMVRNHLEKVEKRLKQWKLKRLRELCKNNSNLHFVCLTGFDNHNECLDFKYFLSFVILLFQILSRQHFRRGNCIRHYWFS